MIFPFKSYNLVDVKVPWSLVHWSGLFERENITPILFAINKIVKLDKVDPLIADPTPIKLHH